MFCTCGLGFIFDYVKAMRCVDIKLSRHRINNEIIYHLYRNNRSEFRTADVPQKKFPMTRFNATAYIACILIGSGSCSTPTSNTYDPCVRFCDHHFDGTCPGTTFCNGQLLCESLFRIGDSVIFAGSVSALDGGHDPISCFEAQYELAPPTGYPDSTEARPRKRSKSHSSASEPSSSTVNAPDPFAVSSTPPVRQVVDSTGFRRKEVRRNHDALRDSALWNLFWGGDELHSALTRFDSTLKTGLLDSITRFPFQTSLSSDLVLPQAQVSQIHGILRIYPVDNTYVDLATVKVFLAQSSQINMFEQAVNAMLGRVHNSGLTDPYSLGFAREILGLYEGLVKECDLPTGLIQSLRSVEPSHLIPAWDAPLAVLTWPEAAEFLRLQHCHAILGCSLCDPLGTYDMVAYADAVLSAMESAHLMRIFSIFSQEGSVGRKRAKDHFMGLINISPRLEPHARDLLADSMCRKVSSLGIDFVKRTEDIDEGDIGTVIANHNGVLGFLRFVCGPARLSLDVRKKNVIPLLRHGIVLVPQTHVTLMFETDPSEPYLVSESLEQVIRVPSTELLGPSQWTVRYRHKEARGIGVLVDWVSFVLRDSVKSMHGIFDHSDDQRVVYPSSEAATSQLRALGRIMGKALKLNVVAGIPLSSGTLFWITQWGEPNALRRVSHEVAVEWAREISSTFVDQLFKLRDPDVLEECLGFVFPPSFPGDQVLTWDNTEAYIDAWVLHKAIGSIKSQAGAILDGISEIIPFGTTKWYTLDELRDMIAGPSDPLSVEAIRLSSSFTCSDTAYQAPEQDWLWEVLEEFDQRTLGGFLEFASGSPYPPIGGFPPPGGEAIWLQLGVDPDMLGDSYPKSRTCFKQVWLPKYSSKDKLRERLSGALTENKAFENI